MLPIILPADPDRHARLGRLYRRAEATPAEVEASARRIVDDVRARGDAAVREHTERLERRTLGALEIEPAAREREAARVAPEVRAALERAHGRIRRFCELEREALRPGFEHVDDEGVRLEWRAIPLDRVGIYVPGGTARYPSSVLMTAVAADVAGVVESVLVCPSPSPEVLLAASLARVTRVFAIGGAQAIGALAYGTESVPRVAKIVGPGNAYVAAAKRLVYGEVDIDQVAGPSEVLVIAGAGDRAELVAADLIAQAEHDADSYAVLVTDSVPLARAVDAELERQLPSLPRRAIAERALREHGAIVVVRTLEEALAIAEAFAPEHLQLFPAVAGDDVVHRVRSAGAVFVGPFTPVPVGDYLAGPSHVLPTGGAGRFGSPVGVHTFLKRVSIVAYDEPALRGQADDLARLAEVEGLEGHARAVRLRFPSRN